MPSRRVGTRGQGASSSGRRLLVIAHDFPPYGGVGVMRALKYVKFLQEFGWTPEVFTRRPGYLPTLAEDPSLLAQVPPGVRVHRTRALARRVGSPPAWLTRPGALQEWIGRRINHLRTRSDFGYQWLPGALPALARLLLGRRFDAVFTTSPPHATHLLGAWARAVHGVPWVADFRDGWNRDPLYRARSPRRQVLDRALERLVIRRADRVITATATLYEWFRMDHGTPYAGKARVIFNGFDPDDWSLPSPAAGASTGPRPVRMVHTGMLWEGQGREIRPLLEAFRRVSAEASPGAPAVALELMGHVPDADRALAAEIPGVVVTPHQPHAAAVRALQAADVSLLVLGTTSPDALTGKFFEYLAAGHPILALAGPGPLRELIEREHLGWAVAGDDGDGIARVLRQIRELHAAGTLASMRPDPGFVSQFDRRHLTGLLAGVLDAACHEATPATRPAAASR